MVEPLTIFAHLDSEQANYVRSYLRESDRWRPDEMKFDDSSDILMTTTQEARDVVMSVLLEIGLAPVGETRFVPV